MDKDSKGQIKMDSGGGLLPPVEGHMLEQNSTEEKRREEKRTEYNRTEQIVK